MERFSIQRPTIVVVDSAAGDVAAAIRALTDRDLLRLQALARLWTRGMPGSLGWADVMHEAITRALDGSRRWPAGISILAFLSGVMRSICDDHWRFEVREARVIVRNAAAAELGADDAGLANPERVVAAAQAIADIHRLFAGDDAALKIIAGLADGLSAAEICKTYGMSEREYDTTRKRMRRGLLRFHDGSEP